MDKEKSIILLLIAVIAILLVLIGMTIVPSMMRENCNLEITSGDLLENADNITVKLSDSKNNPISSKNIKITLANTNKTEEYSVKTDSNGTATLNLNENTTERFNLTCSFEGDEAYNPTSSTKEITIKSVIEASSSGSSSQDSIDANRPTNDPNYKGYTPNHESEVINGWDPSEHETYRESMSDGNQKIHYDDGYFRLVDENGYVITYGYG